MPSCKVSIIVNNYNYGRYVEAAIDSAFAQTYPNCEVIIVDDGSTDDSRERIAQYEGRAKIVLKENGGQASAFNAGFAIASGRLIAFLDSDDVLFPEAIEMAVSAWEEGVAKVQFPLEVLNARNERTGTLMPRARLSRGDLLEQSLESGRYVASPTSGNLFSRDFLASVSPIPVKDWRKAADGFLNTAAPFYGTIAAVDRPLGLYRIHGGNMTSIAHDGKVSLAQIEGLILQTNLGRSLLEKLSRERGLKLSKRALLSHWIYLKLRLSFCKLTDPAGRNRFRTLASTALEMLVSVLRAKDLNVYHKIQHIAWVFGVAVLPLMPAKTLICYAFDTSPEGGVIRRLRRA